MTSAQERLERQHIAAVITRAKAIDAAREYRDEAIRDAMRDGVPVQRIAEAAGATRGRIYQLAGTEVSK